MWSIRQWRWWFWYCFGFRSKGLVTNNCVPFQGSFVDGNKQMGIGKTDQEGHLLHSYHRYKTMSSIKNSFVVLEHLVFVENFSKEGSSLNNYDFLNWYLSFLEISPFHELPFAPQSSFSGSLMDEEQFIFDENRMLAFLSTRRKNEPWCNLIIWVKVNQDLPSACL